MGHTFFSFKMGANKVVIDRSACAVPPWNALSRPITHACEGNKIEEDEDRLDQDKKDLESKSRAEL
jgi:hypothetical protein